MPKKLKPNLNQADIQMILEIMRIHFLTRNEFDEFKSDIFDKLDLIIKYTKPVHDELLVTQAQVDNHSVRLDRIDEVLNLPALS